LLLIVVVRMYEDEVFLDLSFAHDFDEFKLTELLLLSLQELHLVLDLSALSIIPKEVSLIIVQLGLLTHQKYL
jgi:hypothetical protein